MKFIHIADVHLGAKPDRGFSWSEEREKERYQSFESIIYKCNEMAIDLLLIAGDLFSKQPTIGELKEVNYLFSTLKTTKVVIIAGNHDFIGLRSNYTKFVWNENVFLFLKEEWESYYIEELNTEIYGFSYHTRELHEPRFHFVSPKADDRIHILLGHGGSVDHAPMDKNKMLQSEFDYIALGHIHKPQIFGEKMAYSGSLEPMDKTEVGPRGHVLGEIQVRENKKELTIDFIQSALREYKRMDIQINKHHTMGEIKRMIADFIEEYGVHHIYILNLAGKRDRTLTIAEEDLYPLGNIIEVNNKTEPDYDYEELYIENKDNLIGRYIRSIKEMSEEEAVKHTALYYGIEALLGAKTK